MNAHTQKNGTPAKLKSLWQLENQRGWAKDNQQTPKVRRVEFIPEKTSYQQN
jgi:hypothetical protein